MKPATPEAPGPGNSYVLNDRIKAIPVAIDTDHPLSLGYRVILVTDSKWCEERTRVSTRDLREYMGASTANGCHNVYNNLLIITITLNGRDMKMVRIVELLVHEVSHLVDAMFDRCVLTKIDTELRAYYNDWMVGKLLHKFPTML